MFPKLLVVIVFCTLLAAAVLGLREQRLAVRHQMARLQTAMDHSRRQTWDMQVRVAQATRAAALRRAIRQAGLVLEPVVPTPAVMPPQLAKPMRVARASPVMVPYKREGR